jgi:hypothetical protein
VDESGLGHDRKNVVCGEKPVEERLYLDRIRTQKRAAVKSMHVRPRLVRNQDADLEVLWRCPPRDEALGVGIRNDDAPQRGGIRVINTAGLRVVRSPGDLCRNPYHISG